MSTLNRTARSNNPDSNNGQILLHGTYMGFVKNNIDSQKMGRLEVYIPEIGGDPQKPSDWIIVGYASMFAGASNPNAVRKDSKTEAGTQSSYGWWGVPPDLDNQVLVTFVNGDMARGYWFACVFQQEMNQMVPGIAAAATHDPAYKTKPQPPTAEYNKANEANPAQPTRAVFAPLADSLAAQGLQGDAARGPSTASSRRAPVAKVYGLVSPRGQQMYIDDDGVGEGIRLRTRSGTQVLINETAGFVYINSKSGNAWVEISDDGIDIYSKGSISLRAEQDFNVRADKNILLDAGGSIFTRSGAELNMQTGGGITAGAGGALVLSSETKASLSVVGDFLVSVSGSQHSQTGADATLRAGGNITEMASGTLSNRASGTMIRQAPSIKDNPGSAPFAPPVTPSPAVVPKPAKAPDIQGGKSASVMTIVNRLPTHEPWGKHPQPPPASKPSHASGSGASASGASASSASGSGASSSASSGSTSQAGVSDSAVDTGSTGSAGSNTTAALPANANTIVQRFSGKQTGSGQCVALVQAATGVGTTHHWQQGNPVTAANIGSIPPGTAIASFQNGTYNNRTNGDSHAAILLGPGTTADGKPGILVLDQWSGHAASQRVLAFNAYNKTAGNNGSAFSVINTKSA